MLSQVGSQRQPVIVRRNGKDLAALVPLEHLEILREVLSRQKAEELAAGIDWEKAVANFQPSPAWFDGDEPKPF
ncbi:MAG: hypothetical protein HUU20_24835, partial [Pirellulales bacterium]|nr:hypothetical protein [Pirellulales bacterium]